MIKLSSTIFLCTFEKSFLTFEFESTIIHSMKEYEKKPWTFSERQWLKQNYGKMTVREMEEHLPGRTENSIRKQVHYLRRRRWTFN